MDSGCPTVPVMMAAYKPTATLTQPTDVMDDELRELIEGMDRNELRDFIQRMKKDVADLEKYDFKTYYDESLPHSAFGEDSAQWPRFYRN
jgi:hypothetical protein